ncbi:GNAT family N-acetyltransferase [Actinoplanes sp. NPDC049596]|uniref:GNAT family N-acetyltransferase n=1 Tax=unclassified Actinoplanes TaxID=2626549 RepID=UPI0034120E15
MQPPETIDAGEIVLRSWAPEHAEDLAAAVRASVVELSPFLPFATDAYDVAAARDFIARSAIGRDEGKQFNYAILTADGEAIGSIGLMTERVEPGALEIGYWLRTSFTGRGYMTAAVRALSKVAFGLPGIERLVIRHDAANGASAAVAAKAGFAEVGRERREPQAAGESGVDVIRERRHQ